MCKDRPPLPLIAATVAFAATSASRTNNVVGFAPWSALMATIVASAGTSAVAGRFTAVASALTLRRITTTAGFVGRNVRVERVVVEVCVRMPRADSRNCGKCGNVCTGSNVCKNGFCVVNY